jgi:hypothetical protein
MITVAPCETIPGKSFTDLAHTSHDFQVMRFMVTCLHLCMNTGGDISAGERGEPWMFHHPSTKQWVYRIVITQPKLLIGHFPLTIVGFFGLRRGNADIKLAQSLDRGLIPELSQFDSLLAYVSISLPTGNFGNLVVFTSPEGKDDWGRSEKHREAVRILTPDFYSAVRLYNGQLPDGILYPETARLDLVKYYDYRDEPIWRAVRPLQNGAIR